MSKPALTYYYDVMSACQYNDLQLYPSGRKAMAALIANAPNYFGLPVKYKSQPHLTKDRQYSIGFAFRKLIARFLTPEEAAIYRQYGDKVRFDPATETIVPPADPSADKTQKRGTQTWKQNDQK